MMQYTSEYDSPLGKILIASDEQGIIGLWFEGQKYFAKSLGQDKKECETVVIKSAKVWLDSYFQGKYYALSFPVHLTGTAFQREVWSALKEIPYGKTMTYGELAAKIAEERGTERMSAQAIGGAVGHNPVAIIVPCHRVIGADGSLTGYAGGIEKKRALLALEGV